MKFLTNLFSTAPDSYAWPTIATSISSGFQTIKLRWFNECVVAVDLGLYTDKQVANGQPESAPNTQALDKVVHSELGGDAALAITAYQIHCASTLIDENGYIAKSSTKDFLDLLCGRVSGINANELLQCVRRYEIRNNDASKQRFNFGSDVARYITDREPSMILSLHVASLAEKLFASTSVVIAKAFGDSAKVHKLSRQITLLERQLRPNW